MRKPLLITTAAVPSMVLAASMAANAADLRAPSPAYVPPPFSWTGFYLGGNLGGAWTQGNVTDTLFGLNFSDANSNGVFIGGGQLGFNWQFSNIVVGIEGDFDWAGNTNNTGSGVFFPTIGTIQVTSNNNWITTVAARFGVTYDRWLLYAKGGGGWVGNNNFTVTNLTTGASISGLNSNTNSGWLVGGGIEYAFANNWSAKLEYDYLGLDNQTFTVPAGSPVLANDVFTQNSRNIQMLKLGLNYLFNGRTY